MHCRVLVTGGCGYIGSALVPQLLEKNYDVVVIDNLLHGVNYLESFLDQITFIEADINDAEAVEQALVGVNFVIHLAAIVGYPACDADPELAERTNIDGTRTLLACMRPHQRLVYASTGSCYGSNTLEMCSEETRLNPLTVYGLSKAKAEQMCLSRGHISLRLATLFGVSYKFRHDLLMATLTADALKYGKIHLYEPHFQRTFLHVKDAAKAFIFAIENFDRMKGDVFNVGQDNMNLSKYELAVEIAEMVPGTSVFVDPHGEDKDKRNYRVNFAKIRKQGFKADINIQEGIRETIAYYAQQGLH